MEKYERPEIYRIDTITSEMLASSYNLPEEEKDDIIAGANKRPRNWGNLWK